MWDLWWRKCHWARFLIFVRALHFLLSVSFHQCSILIHSFIYHQRWIIFFSQHFSFPCQYHSANAPYSFIHLPPTLYNVFLPVLQFPLSVPFHQCPYSFIHLPPTLYNVFLPVLQFPLSVSFHHCSILIHLSTTHTI